MKKAIKEKLSSKPHYRVKLFYARSHELIFHSEMEAKRWLQARSLTSQACHYSELWKMKNETDGEQLGVFENSNILLCPDV